MIISIGSRSQPKISAICRAFSKYPEIWMNSGDYIKFMILSKEARNSNEQQKDTISKVSLNPVSLEETIVGAKNRAFEAYNYALEQAGSCDYGVGIEAGIFPVNQVKTGYFDTSACAIYGNNQFYVGCSPLFEYPQKVVDRVLNGEEVGVMKDYFGDSGKGRKGAIGILTSERLYRDDFEESAVTMALIQLVNSQLYM